MRRSLLLLFCSILATVATAQDAKVDFYDGEFFFAEEDYEEALYAFNQVYKQDYQDNAYINYRIGLCLLHIQGRKTESIPYLEKAVNNISTNIKEGKFGEEHAPPDATLYLGNAYRINMEMEKALVQYNEFAQYIDPKDEDTKRFVDQQILSCGNSLVAVNNPVPYTIGNLGQLNESHRSMYNIVISSDLQTLAFMGKNPFYSGVYVATKEGDVWSKPMNISPSIVSDGNMDVVALSADGKTMLLAVADEFDSNIYTAVYEDNRWNPAESLGKPINSKYYESHATFSPDEKSIYFTSNRKGSLGGMDIFRSDLQEDGLWGDPVNLGPAVNTVLNEESPFLSPDGKRLYFSSQGHVSMGGYDVFYTDLLEDGSWQSTPVNLGFPLNTTDDDYTITPSGIHQEGVSYIFANSKLPEYDILQFQMIGRDATPVPVPMEEPEEEEVAVVDETPVAVPVVVKPPVKYLIRPIFFEFDSYSLTDEETKKLEDLSILLEKFPALTLEITGHTDAVGTFEYNKRLSLNRAESISKYLILNGVTKDRLTTIGMSESEHVARNRTRDNRDAPKGRALNRRAQFKVSISKTDEAIIEIEKIDVPDDLKLD
ncbi:MAG: OmpA family protein [Bacteroidota bacterium]